MCSRRILDLAFWLLASCLGWSACLCGVFSLCVSSHGTERVDELIFRLLARLSGEGFSLEKGHLSNVG